MNLSGAARLFIAFLFAVISIGAFSQDTDSLWSVWNDPSQADSSKMKAMKVLSWYTLFRDYDSGYVLAEMLYELSEKADDKSMLTYSYKVMGISNDLQGKQEEALERYREGLALAKKEGLQNEEANFYNNMGLVFRRQGKLTEAHDVYSKSILILEEQNNRKTLATTYNNLALVYLDQENIPLALEYFQKSLGISEELNDVRRKGLGYHNLGLLYEDQGDLEKALDYLKRSEKLFIEMNNKRYLASTYSNIGIVNKDLNKLDTALSYYEKALEVFFELEDEPSIAKAYINIGNIYKIRSDFNNGMYYYNKALPLIEKIDAKKDMSSLYFDIGSLYNKFDRHAEAKKWCDKSYVLAIDYDYLEERKNACECLRDAHKGLNNLLLAYNYQEEFYTIADSLREVENIEEVTRLAMRFEFDKERLADSLVREEEKLINEIAYQEDLNAEKARRNAFMIFGMGVMVLAAALLYRLYFIRRTNKKLAEKNKIIEREKQRAEESKRLKEQFFNNVSHEFRTPLTLILGPINRLLEKVKDKDTRKDIRILQRNANRLHSMINELLDLYKLESGKLKLEAKKTDITQFVNRYIQSFESFAKEKNIKLVYKALIGANRIYIDSVKIEKVLGNLLSNAFKFVDEGGQITVVVEEYALHGKPGVKISVEDTGIGIPKEKMDNVFDRFYQVEDSLSRNYQGTGIGLSLSKELVELHRGSIWVESQEGIGTTFSFFLPSGSSHLKPDEIIEESAKTELTESTEEPEPGEEALTETELVEHKKNGLPILLIVEDNPDMRAFIKEDFRNSFKVIEAGNGEEGLEKAINEIPDVIISDVMMPIMDGNKLCDRIKSDERTSHIPVVMLTARSSVEHRIEGLEKGADAYIAKPFDSRELQVTVRNLVAQRQKLREKFAASFKKGIMLEAAEVTSMDQQFMEKAVKVVEENISDHEFSVETFCGEIAMSRVQLHRKLKALTNQSTSKFVRTIRLKRSAELLSQQGANVTETAFKFGFNNMSYFAKCFQEEYGMTPSAYLAEHSKT